MPPHCYVEQLDVLIPDDQGLNHPVTFWGVYCRAGDILVEAHPSKARAELCARYLTPAGCPYCAGNERSQHVRPAPNANDSGPSSE